MFRVVLVFATFYSKNLNFYESVTKCTNIRVAVLKGVLKFEGMFVRFRDECLASQPGRLLSARV